MAIDITTFGTKKARKNIDGVMYNSTKSALRYFVQFQNSDILDAEDSIKMTYRVLVFVKYNTVAVPTGEFLNFTTYIIDFHATKDIYVDKNGIIVAQANPAAWGTEYDFLLTLLTANDPNGSNMTDYQKLLFDRGVFDFPKG